mmetsp:Transcript_39439/g.85815  ORF Transcript_39439/g.85815 Transcript_39439/m.85815 type:complete len:227 (+) Transcript_39439:5069-5749(+)
MQGSTDTTGSSGYELRGAKGAHPRQTSSHRGGRPAGLEDGSDGGVQQSLANRRGEAAERGQASVRRLLDVGAPAVWPRQLVLQRARIPDHRRGPRRVGQAVRGVGDDDGAPGVRPPPFLPFHECGRGQSVLGGALQPRGSSGAHAADERHAVRPLRPPAPAHSRRRVEALQRGGCVHTGRDAPDRMPFRRACAPPVLVSWGGGADYAGHRDASAGGTRRVCESRQC